MVKKKGAKKKRFKGAVSRNAAKQSRGAQFGHLNLPKGISMFREEPKTRVNMDILPYIVTDENHPDRDDEYEVAVPGELWYKRPYWIHRSIGTNNESVVCPGSIKKECPICKYRAQLLKDGADWNDDSVRALKPSMRNLYAIIPKGQKNYNEEIHLWDISQFLFQDTLNEEIQENEEYETFPDLEEGHTLKIRFSEEQLGTNKFPKTSRIDFNERDKPYDEAILEEVPSLDELLVVPSTKELEALFFGGLTQDELEDELEDEDKEEDEAEEDDADEDEDEEDEEEEEEEEDEAENEEKDEKPKRGKGKQTATKKGGDQKGKKGKAADKCPHGHTFGEDCEEHDECDDCEKWEACIDASEE